jgi:kynureninase
MNRTTDIGFAHEMDANDVLAPFRERFVITDPNLIYLDGNSLGRLPKATIPFMQDAIERAWGDRLIRLWNDGWVDAPRALGTKLAHLIGADPDQVVLTDSTSVNLFKLAVAALRGRPKRLKIVSDQFNFPTDLYVLQGAIDLLDWGHQLQLVSSYDTITIPEENLRAVIDDQTALVSLTHVAYKSAFRYDIEQVTRWAHQAGALVLWDLSHSVGAMPLALDAWNVDLAVGCTYKYLNGGPGSPAFLYVRRGLQRELKQPVWGWFAAREPFAFALDFEPAPGIDRFRAGTPPMLSMKALEPSLDLALEAGLDHVRAKSEEQTEYLIYLADQWLAPLGFTLGSPRDVGRRGSHVSLRHPEGYRISRALVESAAPAIRVIGDFRPPDNIRLGVAPLYNTFAEIHRALDRIRTVVVGRLYELYSEPPGPVT